MLVHDGRPADRRVHVRIVARLRGRALDRALSDGADPAASPHLAARAATITTRAMRCELADSLDRLARTADEPRGYWRVLPFRRAAQANASELNALAALLRSSTPVFAQGVAILRTLVRDGTGPAYTDRHGSTFARHLRNARTAAAGHQLT